MIQDYSDDFELDHVVLVVVTTNCTKFDYWYLAYVLLCAPNKKN